MTAFRPTAQELIDQSISARKSITGVVLVKQREEFLAIAQVIATLAVAQAILETKEK